MPSTISTFNAWVFCISVFCRSIKINHRHQLQLRLDTISVLQQRSFSINGLLRFIIVPNGFGCSHVLKKQQNKITAYVVAVLPPSTHRMLIFFYFFTNLTMIFHNHSPSYTVHECTQQDSKELNWGTDWAGWNPEVFKLRSTAFWSLLPSFSFAIFLTFHVLNCTLPTTRSFKNKLLHKFKKEYSEIIRWHPVQK